MFEVKGDGEKMKVEENSVVNALRICPTEESNYF